MKNQTKSNILAVILSLCITLTACLLGTLIGTVFLSEEYLSEESMGFIAKLVVLISSFSGAMVCRNMFQGERLVGIAVYAGCYLAVLITVSLMLFDRQMEGVPGTVIACIAGCIPACIEKKRGIRFKNNQFRYGR